MYKGIFSLLNIHAWTGNRMNTIDVIKCYYECCTFGGLIVIKTLICPTKQTCTYMHVNASSKSGTLDTFLLFEKNGFKVQI